MGPRIPPSTRVKAKARDSWVRDHPNALSNATNQRPIAWNIGVEEVNMTNPLTGTSHHP